MRPANLDGRYPHFLRPLALAKRPERIICVDPTSEVVEYTDRPGVRTEQFTGWSARCLSRHNGKLGMVYVESGSTIESFWTGLKDELRHPGSVLIVSWQCGRAWSLLQLWHLLESRYCRVAGRDSRATQGLDRDGRQIRPGLLVAEDCPNIVQLRIGTEPGNALWIDCRNWGIDLPSETTRGRAVAERLAEVVSRLDVLADDDPSLVISPTVAGTAWRSWRQTDAAKQCHVHCNPPALELERASHHGGRAECFYVGHIRERMYCLDIRSSYGFVMATAPIAVRLVGYTATPQPIAAEDADNAMACIARVRVKTSEPAYPRSRDLDTIYPVGEFETVLCGPELVDAVRHDRVTQWIERAMYETEYVCQKWALQVYTVRERADMEGDTTVSAFAKGLLVCMAGKLGSKLRMWETVPTAVAPEPWTEWYQPCGDGELQRWRSLGSVVQKEIRGSYAPDSIPSAAAFITSYGRMHLLSIIRSAGWHNVYYCDTDSVIVNEHGYAKLLMLGMVSQGELGSLELRQSSEDTEITAIKTYRMGKSVKAAGLPKGTYTESVDGRGQWYTPPPARGAAVGIEQGANATLTPPPRKEPYRHGIVGSDGRVSPLELHDR